MSQNYERLYTVKQVAKIFQVDSTTVRRWIKGGNLEAIELPGGKTKKIHRIRKSAVDAILQQTSKEDKQ